MKKLFGLTIFSLLILGTAFSLKPSLAHAASNNNLIDDGIFDNTNSMSAAQIDTWLNGFAGSCISPNNGFTAADPIGYSPNSSFVDGHYTYGSPVTAGHVIYDAAVAHGINPEVLLTKLQNEEQLVDGSAGCDNWRYTSSAGYACSDSGTNSHSYTYTGADPYASGSKNLYTLNDSTDLVTPMYYKNGSPVNSITGSCVSSNVKAGFSEQVVHAAWFLSVYRHKARGDVSWASVHGNWNHCEDNATCAAALNIPNSWSCYSGPMTQGDFKLCSNDTSTHFFDGYTTIDGVSVHMDTGATAALYYYTPHFQSFNNIFTPWFGSAYVPTYSWQLLNVSYSTNGPTFVAGQPGTITVTVKNTGTGTWSNGGGSPVNLATWSPPGHNSPLSSPGWISPNTLANMNESSVVPGATATFTIPINVSKTGTYVDAWNLIIQNVGWMGWQGLSPTINIIPAYSWRINSVTYGNGTGVMIPGAQQLIAVDATNTGGATWSKSTGPSVELATWGPGRNSTVMPTNAPQSWLSNTAAARMTQNSVAPGETADFQFYVQMPGFGYYYERFNLVAQGQQWFNDVGLTLYLKGGSYSWQPVSTSYSNGTTNVSRGSTFTVTVKARNTGEATWYKTSPWPLNIATDFPENRGSILYDAGWLNSTTPAGLQEDSVAPGQQGTFVFPVTVAAGSSPGTWNEHFNLVAQGLTWLNDPGFSLNLSIH